MNATTAVTAQSLAIIAAWLWDWVAPRWGGPAMPNEVAVSIGGLLFFLGSRFVDGRP